MLTDNEILNLRKNDDYRNLIDNKFKNAVHDLLKSTNSDFRPELSWGLKLLKSFVKERIIRNEFSETTQNFLENILNRELSWPRVPQSVQDICL